ncbi:MAG: HprK-related kinase A [Pseudomonadota bacterium]
MARALAGGGLTLRVGPLVCLLRSPSRRLARDFHAIYGAYPAAPENAWTHFVVSVDYTSRLRRFVRPKMAAYADFPAPFVPLPERLAFLALEMAMNWQVAMGSNLYLLAHAASVGDAYGRAVMMVGASGSGKSTLAAALGWSGWRFLGDEFVLLSLDKGLLHAFPRPISLKNDAIAVMRAAFPKAPFSRPFEGTAKGRIVYMTPPLDAVREAPPAMAPGLILMPHFSPGAAPQARACPPAETFGQIISASVNYGRLGAPAFHIVARLARAVPAYHIRYGDLAAGMALVAELARKHGEEG